MDPIWHKFQFDVITAIVAYTDNFAFLSYWIPEASFEGAGGPSPPQGKVEMTPLSDSSAFW